MTMEKWVLAMCLVVHLGVALSTDSLGSYVLVSVVVTDYSEQEFLRNTVNEDAEIEFWNHPACYSPTNIFMPGSKLDKYRQKWTAAGMVVTVKQKDVEKLIAEVEAEDERLKQQLSKTGEDIEETTLKHSTYRSYDEMRCDLVKLRDKFGSKGLIRFDETGTTVPLGKTAENRTIHHIELGTGSNEVILIEANIHAREWISSAATFFMIDKLLTGYGRDDDVTNLLDNNHLVIIPVANPDGYEYSRTESETNRAEYRLWSKNRRPVYDGCQGVDLNSNFDYEWKNSSDCNNAYPGPSAFSEAETQAIKKLLNAYKNRLAMYLSVRSFGQVIFLPLASDEKSCPVNEAHSDVAKTIADDMWAVDRHRYVSGTPWSIEGYTANVPSTDWAFMEMVKVEDQPTYYDFLSIGLKMRPDLSSNNGFILPASEIVPTGRELLAGVLAAKKKHNVWMG